MASGNPNTQTALLAPENFPEAGHYLVGFSGGADSTALLLAAHDALPSEKLTALHVNHGVNEKANEWEMHCRNICRDLGISFISRETSPNPNSKLGTEGELRRIRYACFKEQLSPGAVLLLAHHLEDQAETILLHLLRGSGLEGLSGMPRERKLGAGMIYRPLLGTSRKTLEEFLRHRGVGWIDDPSNEDSSLDRNFIRREVMPLLRSRWASADASMARSAGHLGEAAELLDRYVLSGFGDFESCMMPLGALPDHDKAVLKAAIRSWLRARGLQGPPGARLEEFVSQLDGARLDSSTELAWSEGRLRLYREQLWLSPEIDAEPLTESSWDGSSPLDLGSAGKFSIVGSSTGALPPGTKVCPRRAGLKFRGGPDQPGKDVSELLRVAGIPPWLRNQVPLLVFNEAVQAVGDWLLSQELKALLKKEGAQLRWDPIDSGLLAICQKLRTPVSRVDSRTALG